MKNNEMADIQELRELILCAIHQKPIEEALECELSFGCKVLVQAEAESENHEIIHSKINEIVTMYEDDCLNWDDSEFSLDDVKLGEVYDIRFNIIGRPLTIGRVMMALENKMQETIFIRHRNTEKPPLLVILESWKTSHATTAESTIEDQTPETIKKLLTIFKTQ